MPSDDEEDDLNDEMRQCVAGDVFKKALEEELNEFVELEKMIPDEEIKQSSTEPETEIEIPVEPSDDMQ